ncbi:MAG TPA: OmpA family protein [Vicinamibacterales bacterium]|nr:OmpA family protein [Vicinamibacterales bacterium]
MIAATLTLAVASGAAAQTPSQTSPQTTPPAGTSGQTTASTGNTMSGDVQTRPATTTFMGDTGLWYVPTGEVLPRKKWSFSAYRVNFDDNQGFTDVSNWPVTFGVGLGDRAEIFGSWVLVSRVDRDIRPLFLSSIPGAGGVVPQNPLMKDTWSGNQLGDLWVGGKWNITSEFRQQPAAFALRAMVKLPTDKKDEGAGTGKADFAFDGILSKEINQRAEVSGYAGFIVRGAPSEVEETNGFRWGFGAGFPSRKSLRFTAELTGEKYSKSSIATKTLLTATDGSFLPVGFSSTLKSPVDLGLGLTWQSAKGVFAGVGWTWRLNMDKRDQFLTGPTNGAGDKMDIVGRIGYHPGVRVYVPPPPPPPPPPPAAPAHELSVKAACNPCTVEVGKTSTVTATPNDSIGCSVTYAWSAPAGTFTNGTAQSTPWTAPMQEGPVPVTVTVRCPTDNKTASDTVTIQVVRPPAAAPIVFEDVHFDFDRYSLRPEAVRTLDEAVRVLQQNPDVRVEIEGHTCNIGTAEYNLALGERRANSVKDYLVSRGISADRFRTISYGEERPKYDNAREETRRLNRRAALVVRLVR